MQLEPAVIDYIISNDVCWLIDYYQSCYEDTDSIVTGIRPSSIDQTAMLAVRSMALVTSYEMAAVAETKRFISTSA